MSTIDMVVFMLELSFYALLAVFIFSKLYAALGRMGDLEGTARGLVTDVADVMESLSATEGEKELLKKYSAEEAEAFTYAATTIRMKDDGFFLHDFLSSASEAYELIVTAFNSRDLDSVKSLLSAELFERLEQAMRTARENGKLSTFVGIKSAELISISFDGNVGVIEVKFLSERITSSEEKNVFETSYPSEVIEFKREFTKTGDYSWIMTSVKTV